jgi:hypothetical protein
MTSAPRKASKKRTGSSPGSKARPAPSGRWRQPRHRSAAFRLQKCATWRRVRLLETVRSLCALQPEGCAPMRLGSRLVALASCAWVLAARRIGVTSATVLESNKGWGAFPGPAPGRGIKERLGGSEGWPGQGGRTRKGGCNNLATSLQQACNFLATTFQLARR